jgi:hypothetical protein
VTRSQHRAELEELYRLSSADDAMVLLWALRVCDECPPSEWPESIRARGGPNPVRVRSVLRRLGVRALEPG